MADLISVIVPVYNIEDYIDRCVESIVNQTYSNLEIILVDDGSEDRSPEICDMWKKKDKRIKVIHKENGGLSDARNVGIKIATGECYSFVDGDDEIKHQMIEYLYSEMIAAKADISMCRMEKIEAVRKYETRTFPSEAKKIEMTGVEAAKLLLTDIIDCSACLKLYRKELFRNIKFPYGKTNEDFAVMYKLFGNSRRIVYISDCLYLYYFRENSITSSKFNESQFDKVDNCIEMVDYIQKYLPSLVDEAYFYFYRQTMYLLKTLCMLEIRTEYLNRYIQLRKILKQGTLRILKCKWLTKKEKVMYFTLTWMPGIYVRKHKKQKQRRY